MDVPNIATLIGAILGAAICFVISRRWQKRQQEKERLHGLDVKLNKLIFSDKINPHKKGKQKKQTKK